MSMVLRQCWHDEAGQHLIDYSPFVVFVALASAVPFISFGTSISSVWSDSNTELYTAARCIQ
jgi:Flp pilus assembly pilin Flp